MTVATPAAADGRTPAADLRSRRWALVLIVALAGLCYAWAIGTEAIEPYYQAAVLSMSASWHDFVYGAFDPAGTITMDKLPGAFWVQALFVRVLGFHVWVIVLPQVLEGVGTVLVLYRAVARVAGGPAGLVAALVLAVSPATVALDRGNIADTLMVLLLVLAADAVTAALTTGRTRALVLAGVWLGLAFQTKMLEAWLVLPALAFAYGWFGPDPGWRRVRQLGLMTVVSVVVSLAWMIAVSLVPAGDRPYVDGSHDDSLFQMVFQYNGFGRYSQQTPLQLLQSQSINVIGASANAPRGVARLLYDDLGRDSGWLLPLALVVAVCCVIARRGRPRHDPLRALFVLWGGWLCTFGATFSSITLLNPYYLGVLTPAIAAILGTGVAVLWSRPGGRAVRIGLTALLAGTVGYAVFLIPATGTDAHGWQRVVVLVVGIIAVGVAVGAVLDARERLSRGAVLAGVVAILIAPTIASAELVGHDRGALDTPFEPAAELSSVDSQFGERAGVASYLPQIRSLQVGAPDLAATQTSGAAAFYIDASGQEVLPIGGLTGTIPAPTLAQLRADIQAGTFHLVFAANDTDPRIGYVASHCQHLPGPPGDLVYYCIPGDAGPLPHR